MIFDNFQFCYRAPFYLSYKNGPIDKSSHFKYKNYCGSAYFTILSYLLHMFQALLKKIVVLLLRNENIIKNGLFSQNYTIITYFTCS